MRYAGDQVLRIGGLVLNPKKSEVFIDGMLVDGISVKEFEVLNFLGRNSSEKQKSSDYGFTEVTD